MTQKIQVRRDTLANFISNNVVLSMGEPAYTTHDKRFRLGDGATEFNALPVFASMEDLNGFQAQVTNLEIRADDVNSRLLGIDLDITEINQQVLYLKDKDAVIDTAVIALQDSVQTISQQINVLQNEPPLSVIDGGSAVSV